MTRTSRRTLLAAIPGLGAILLLAGMGGARRGSDVAQPVPGDPVAVAGGSASGVYNQYAKAWSAAAGPGAPLRVLATTGSVQNLQLLAAGSASVAFCAIDAAAQASSAGTAAAKAVRALGRLYDDYIHLVVPGPSGIGSIGDLRGRRVCVGAQASGTVLISDRLLTVSGMDPDRDIVRKEMSLDDSAAALRAGTLDAFFWSGGLPTQAIVQLAEHVPPAWTASGTPPLRLIDLTTPARAVRARYGAVYRIGVIPGHTYPGIDVSTTTLAVPNVLLTTTSVSEATARRLVQLLFDDASQIGRTVPVATQLDQHTAIYTEPVPLHPGAVDYYRSVAVYA